MIKKIVSIIQGVKKTEYTPIIRNFISESKPSVYISCNKIETLNDILTQLNSIRPISFNRDFYTKHMVSVIEYDVCEKDIEKLIQSSVYGNTKHVFIKGVNFDNVYKKVNYKTLSNIANQLGVDITMETCYTKYVVKCNTK